MYIYTLFSHPHRLFTNGSKALYCYDYILWLQKWNGHQKILLLQICYVNIGPGPNCHVFSYRLFIIYIWWMHKLFVAYFECFILESGQSIHSSYYFFFLQFSDNRGHNISPKQFLWISGKTKYTIMFF